MATVIVVATPIIHIPGRKPRFQRQCTVYYLYPLRGPCAHVQRLPCRTMLTQEPLLVATRVILLAVTHLRQIFYVYHLTALLLRRENFAAQIEHRQRAWDLYSFTDFENRKVPVQNKLAFEPVASA